VRRKLVCDSDGKKIDEESSVRLVDFWYLGERSRFDEYVSEGSSTSSGRKLLHIHIDTGDRKFGLAAGKSAYVGNGGEGGRYYRQVGSDFHPETYNRPLIYYGAPLTKVLKAMVSSSIDVRVVTKQNGLIELAREGNVRTGPGWRSDAWFVFDPKRGYAVVSCGMGGQIDSFGSTDRWEYEAGFDDAVSKVYPVRVKFFFEQRSKDRNTKGGIDLIEVDVLRFDSTTPIDEKTFTFEALSIPAGFPVGNEVTHEVMAYKPLEETGLLKSLLNREGKAAVGAVTPPDLPKATNTERASAKGDAAMEITFPSQSHFPWGLVGCIAGAVVLLAVGCAFALRRR